MKKCFSTILFKSLQPFWPQLSWWRMILTNAKLDWLYALTWFTANTLRAGSGRQPQGNLMYIGLQYLPLKSWINERLLGLLGQKISACPRWNRWKRQMGAQVCQAVENQNGGDPSPIIQWGSTFNNQTAPFPILKWLKSLTSISSPPWEELCLGFVLETRKQVGRQMATWDRHQMQDQSRLNAGIRKWLNAVKHCKYIAEIATKRRHAGANMAGLACLGSQTGQV